MTENRLQPVDFNSYRPLRELVLTSLREAIFNGTLKPRERLMEVQLAQELGVSRTPVREALRKLEQEGFINIIPRKGAYVAELSLKDIEDVFEIRIALEGLAASLCAERITGEELRELERLLLAKEIYIQHQDLQQVVVVDGDFHATLYQGSHNARLKNILENLRDQIQRYRTTSLSFPGRMDISLKEHRQILQAITKGDGAKASLLLQEHLQNTKKTLLEFLRHEQVPSK